MAATYSSVRLLHLRPDSLEAKSYTLSPNDLFDSYAGLTLSWPLFFNYDIDGDRLAQAIKKLLEKYQFFCGRVRPHEDLRYIIEVNPSQDEESSIPFEEITSEMSIATVIKEHMPLKIDEAFALNFPDLPFYMEKLNAQALFKGEEPLLKVKLTHFSDGCVLDFVVQHMLMDAERYYQTIGNLSRAYRGLEIADREHDRSYLWPDQLVKAFPFLDESIARLPRKIPRAGTMVDLPKLPPDSAKMHVFHIPNDALTKMKALARPFLAEGEYVSSNDVLIALVWMLLSELIAETQPISNGRDLKLDHSVVFFTYELLKNGYPVVPENYSGNAFNAGMVSTREMDLSEEASLPETFTKLAVTMRNLVASLREQPPLVAQGALAHYHMLVTGELPSMQLGSGFRGAFTNLMKCPILEIDFGEGAPVLAHIQGYPIGPFLFAASPGLRGDGVLMPILLFSNQAQKLEQSVVIKEIAPDMRDICSDYSEEELKQKLALPA